MSPPIMLNFMRICSPSFHPRPLMRGGGGRSLTTVTFNYGHNSIYAGIKWHACIFNLPPSVSIALPHPRQPDAAHKPFWLGHERKLSAAAELPTMPTSLHINRFQTPACKILLCVRTQLLLVEEILVFMPTAKIQQIRALGIRYHWENMRKGDLKATIISGY